MTLSDLIIDKFVKETYDFTKMPIMTFSTMGPNESRADLTSLPLPFRQAQEQSEIADQQLNKAKESERDELAKKEQLENELANMNSQAQAKIQAGDK